MESYNVILACACISGMPWFWLVLLISLLYHQLDNVLLLTIPLTLMREENSRNDGCLEKMFP